MIFPFYIFQKQRTFFIAAFILPSPSFISSASRA
jgi:hypothetical protein